jgi:fructose-bisphosphate aldolase class 1
MMAQAMGDTAEELFAGDRGILAMDESVVTCNRRFAAAGIDQEVESRRAYRELLVSTPGWQRAFTARSSMTRRSDSAGTTARR